MSERSEVTFKLRAIADGYDCFPWRGEEMAGFAGRILNLLGGSEEDEASGEGIFTPMDKIPTRSVTVDEAKMELAAAGKRLKVALEANERAKRVSQETMDKEIGRPPRDKDIGSGGVPAGEQAASASHADEAPGASDPCPTCGDRKVKTVPVKGVPMIADVPCPDCTTTEEE